MDGRSVYESLFRKRSDWPESEYSIRHQELRQQLWALLDGADLTSDLGRMAFWSRALYAADPMRLAAVGAPADEYDGEAKLLSVLEARGRLGLASALLTFHVMFDEELVDAYAIDALERLIRSTPLDVASGGLRPERER